MADREAMIRAVKAHCSTLMSQDQEGWLSLWAEDAVLEDPVSVDSFRGIDALRSQFWPIVEACSPLRLEPLYEIIVAGNEALAILAVDSSWGGVTRSVGPIVDHFTFGPDGKIASMRAHWHFARAGYRPELDTPPAERERMVAAVQTHLRASSAGDREAWLAIWAEDAEIEDPVGAPRCRGIGDIGTTFWSKSRNAAPKLTLLQEVIVCGSEAVAVMQAEVGPADSRRTLSPIVDHFTFDAEGKVKSMRALFNY